jgi:hypothetical protein
MAPLKIVTMLSHADVVMYLVTIKSLYRQLGEGSFVVVNDGTLTNKDIEILHHHAGSLEIYDVRDISTEPCPQGGCWERLLTVVGLSSDSYVIQVDSDTLTLDAIPEVVESYRSNRSFILGSKTGRTIAALSKAPEKIPPSAAGSQHVQVLAEQKFVHIDNASNRRYVRGSAGFAGFSRGAFSRRQVEDFSVAMADLLGRVKWSEWGSEQVASNYILANSPEAAVLPYPKYSCFLADFDPAATVFLHFIGIHRFSQGVYTRESKRVIKQLLEEGHGADV